MAAPRPADRRPEARSARLDLPMAPEAGPSTFFARQTYRRRRLMDAARMMPAFGAALFLLPTIWVSVDASAETSAGFVYLFAVWGILILLGRIIARRIMDPLPETPETDRIGAQHRARAARQAADPDGPDT